jgi:hypothetical protein
MKTRNSLVSNSSSTSFIVVYKIQNKCKCCGRGSEQLKDKIEKLSFHGDCDNEVCADTIETVKKYIEDHWFDGERKTELLKKIDSLVLDDDMQILCGKISFHDIDLTEEITSIEKLGGMILYRESE